MKALIVLPLLLASAKARVCDGTCVQGEGDCDRDSDCLPGLKCEFDWWWGTDVCHPGPTTKNFTWTDWGEWGKCIGSFCGAKQVGIRARSRDCIPPIDGGFPCPSQTDEEQEECAMPECPYTEWGDWGRCAGEYCGSDSKGNSYRGSRSRARDCIPADDGQFACRKATDEEREKCDMPECPYSEWGDWTKCAGKYCGADSKGNSYEGYRSRTRDCIPDDDGQFACREATDEEGEKCDMPECPYTDWGEWSKCTGEFCGAGQVGSRTRTRDCIPADDGQYNCPWRDRTDEEEGSCDMPECSFTEWGEWGACSGELCDSPGTNIRTRDCIPADDGSYGCQVPNEEEQGTCDMPTCTWTDWGEWGICLGELCDGPGTNTRTRDCIPADDGSFGCPIPNEEEQGTCDMPACTWTDWGVWSVCGGADCGETGSMSRGRECIPPEDGSYGCPVPNEEEQDTCNMPDCNCFCPA